MEQKLVFLLIIDDVEHPSGLYENGLYEHGRPMMSRMTVGVW